MTQHTVRGLEAFTMEVNIKSPKIIRYIRALFLGTLVDCSSLFTATALSGGWWSRQIDKFHVGLGGSPIGPTRRWTQISTTASTLEAVTNIISEGAYIGHDSNISSSLIINLLIGFKGYRGLREAKRVVKRDFQTTLWTTRLLLAANCYGTVSVAKFKLDQGGHSMEA